MQSNWFAYQLDLLSFGHASSLYPWLIFGGKSEASRSLWCLGATTEFLVCINFPLSVWAQPASPCKGSESTKGRDSCLFTHYSWIFKCACRLLIVAASLDLLQDNGLGHGCWRGSKWTELLVHMSDQKQASRAVPGVIHRNGPKEMNANVNLAAVCKERHSWSVLWRQLLQSELSWSWKTIWETADT